jgi:Coenzyme PQQ synthesis protein D (PqqD)
MSLCDKPIIPSHITARQLGDETMVIDPISGAYFGLDPIGARVWQLIEEGLSFGDICDTMLDEYDVARDALQRDILELASKLLGQKLITMQNHREREALIISSD